MIAILLASKPSKELIDFFKNIPLEQKSDIRIQAIYSKLESGSEYTDFRLMNGQVVEGERGEQRIFLPECMLEGLVLKTNE